MSTTQIPPGTSAAPPPRPDAVDLYDASGWETAYRQMHDVPALLIQLQDDLSRARRREALWMSVIVHLTLVIFIMNSDRFVSLFPRRSVIVMSPDMMKQKDLTYLELPPDEQKLTKHPDTNIISDKDRIATSKKPQLDPKELKKILDSSRPGTPVMSAPPAAQPSPPAVAQSTPPPQMQPQPQAQPQQQPQFQTPTAPANTGQTARLNLPPAGSATPSFNTNMSAGSAIAQAARAAAANRGAYGGGGDGGDYGLGRGGQGKIVDQLEVLSDTMGVDFGPYLQRVLHDVRQNWYNLIPEVARAPLMKKGKVSLEFAITKDGKVAGLQYVSSSGDVALDRAAYGGITASDPFPPLPSEFRGKYLELRFNFFYNPDASDLR
jgi:TonB family protein